MASLSMRFPFGSNPVLTDPTAEKPAWHRVNHKRALRMMCEDSGVGTPVGRDIRSVGLDKISSD